MYDKVRMSSKKRRRSLKTTRLDDLSSQMKEILSDIKSDIDTLSEESKYLKQKLLFIMEQSDPIKRDDSNKNDWEMIVDESE